MELALTILVFVSVAAAVFSFGAAVLMPTSVLGARLRSLGSQRQAQPEKPPIKERIEQALSPLSKAIPLTPKEANKSRGWLIQAGYRESRHETIYFGLRVFCALIGFLIVVVASGFDSPYLLIGIPALGFLLPRFVLKRLIRERQRRIRIALADALDLTVICVEAGLSLDQAMARVGQDLRYAHPDLSDEFYLVNLEMRAGKPRPEALRNLADRTGVDDIRALVGVLIQTDRFGTSVAQALRVHSDALRTERRQRAEEQAAKTTIKMIPALVVFVLPSMFFVTLGPAVIGLIHTLAK
ncbi:MAG: type II secretion system F family protein [Acidobacteria bacterium]|nr:type II secretion system F family protein [Acidobacteriota bacterium]MBV9480160.1 type II secretion system F family protein [Acidobacteriota bacterium]